MRVEAAGVCHTELHYMTGAIACPLPVVLGHEGTGVVEEVGSGVDDLDRATKSSLLGAPAAVIASIADRAACDVHLRPGAGTQRRVDGRH